MVWHLFYSKISVIRIKFPRSFHSHYWAKLSADNSTKSGHWKDFEEWIFTNWRLIFHSHYLLTNTCETTWKFTKYNKYKRIYKPNLGKCEHMNKDIYRREGNSCVSTEFYWFYNSAGSSTGKVSVVHNDRTTDELPTTSSYAAYPSSPVFPLLEEDDFWYVSASINIEHVEWFSNTYCSKLHLFTIQTSSLPKYFLTGWETTALLMLAQPVTSFGQQLKIP